MSYEQVKDVLQQAKLFYKKTANFYEQLSRESDQERVKLLLNYMAKREKAFEQIVDRFHNESKQSIIQQWMQFTPPRTVTKTLDELKKKPIESVDELMQMATTMDDALIEYYRTLVNISRKPEVRDAFINLMEATLKKDREMVFNMHMQQEI
ncbi:MAG: hypothetical protein KDE52_05400 [Calditrichaeota bacterium]|nr:hypothetical protein [Calditrichota bacterium]MCB0270905.1 hypothetical protein [Calditrichota bacterium]MCB0299470.1 hypothetical protein [Calditrichota bacterium]MCB9069062.1 hypothetical protein [Calditrichia bacterium]